MMMTLFGRIATNGFPGRLISFTSAATITTAALVLAATAQGAESRAAPKSLAAYARQAESRHAYGVYVGSNKVGWAIEELKPGRWQEQDTAVSTFEMHVQFKMANTQSISESHSLIHFSLAGEGEIEYAEDTSREDGQTTRHQASRHGRELAVITEAPSGRSERRVPLPRETLNRTRQLDEWLNQPPRTGATFTDYTTDLSRNDPNVRELITYRGRKNILWGGIKTNIHLVDIESDGAVVRCEIASDGKVLRGQIGGILELRAENETLARDLQQAQPIDLIAASQIPADRKLGDPEKVTRLKLELGLEQKFALPASHRQRIISRRNGALTVELRRDFRLEKPSVLSRGEKARYTQSTPALQSDHPELRRLARAHGGAAAGPAERAQLLNRWVYLHLTQTMAVESSTALEVLRRRAGDCTEHSLLVVALCRAAGIPAREVSGIMYGDDDPPVFGWHAWAEIHDGHQWISLDPTWNQVYVDATHLKLAEGEHDWAWINLLGALKIRIIDFDNR